MKETRHFTLERPARKMGGDRYQEHIEPGQEMMMGAPYILQPISRSAGIPKSDLWITISTEKPEE